ncbi:MAG: ferritin-like domain-containing protein [Gemmatimonadaceae bacterium]|nr:ferritin-like domain-containing protein [Gemmatimonadaceae bacterium]
MQLATLHDLMVHQLKDLYSAERQLVQALPRMAKNATSRDLQDAIRKHLDQTEEQVTRLEQCFELLGESSRGPRCKGMEGLIEESKDLFEEDVDEDVLDAGIIANAQRVEHYEIAGYGTVCEYARSMGHEEIAALLEATLEEEKEADQRLTSLAEGGINALAERDGDMEEDEEADAAEGDLMAEDEAETQPTASRTSGRNGHTNKGGRKR